MDNILEETKFIMKKYNIKAKKELGQNFLINKEVIDKIKKICNSVPYTWSVCGIDVVNKIEKILKEVE